jgi:FKBP-type peptidyl-prolyl cis-trans isomerase FklB
MLGVRPSRRKGIEMRCLAMAALWLVLIFGICSAGEKPILEDQRDKESYSLGYQIGGAYKKQTVDMNPDAFMKGLKDGLSGAEPQLSRQEMRSILEELLKRSRAAESAKRKSLALHRKEGKEFLAVNAKKPGVVSLPSGLQYKVIREGTGKTPGPHDTVTVHYRGTRIDGTEFDSSFRNNKPATFRVGGVIAGWTEALQLMKEGSKWQLFIPPDLAYGKRGPMRDRTLIFDVELISVN